MLTRSSGFTFADSDAAAYVTAVEAADAQQLETGVKSAIDALFVGLKADGEWNAFGVLHCLAGPRTLAGLAVPMKGAAPTLVNFVSGDINRKTGLVGDVSTKYINSNRNNNTDGQNNQQMWSYLSSLPSADTTRAIMGVGVAANGSTHIGHFTTVGTGFVRSRSATSATVSISVGLVGISRNNSSNYDYRSAETTTTITQASQTPLAGNIFYYARNNSGSVNSPSNHRAAFKCVGEAWTNPANIEARIDTYMSAIAAAIP
jgi:hypothetical protein